PSLNPSTPPFAPASKATCGSASGRRTSSVDQADRTGTDPNWIVVRPPRRYMALFGGEDRHFLGPGAIRPATIHSGRIERECRAAVRRGYNHPAVTAHRADFGDHGIRSRLRAFAEQAHPRADLVRHARPD